MLWQLDYLFIFNSYSLSGQITGRKRRLLGFIWHVCLNLTLHGGAVHLDSVSSLRYLFEISLPVARYTSAEMMVEFVFLLVRLISIHGR